jgi:hypothetical protein
MNAAKVRCAESVDGVFMLYLELRSRETVHGVVTVLFDKHMLRHGKMLRS